MELLLYAGVHIRSTARTPALCPQMPKAVRLRSLTAIVFVLVAFESALSRSGHAQTIRGSVRDKTTRDLLAGVLVTLEPQGADSVSGAINRLTNSRGEYAFRAPRAGAFRVTAKRIGTRRTFADVTIAEGETRWVTLELDAIAQLLPEVAIVTATLCVRRNEDRPRVAALWDEVNTALSSASIVVRDSLVLTRLSRQTRLLDPRTLRLLEEVNTEVAVGPGAVFTSLSADSLAKVGFWRQTGDTLSFDAPDLRVLLDDVFRRRYCFGLAPLRTDSALIGVTFAPAADTRVPGITGTIWVHASTYELQRIDFTYTHLPRVLYADRIRGEVHFSKLAGGRWIVERWFIRMPRFARPLERTATSSPQFNYRANATSAVAMDRIVETSGRAFPLSEGNSTSAFHGWVFDSTGKPFAGAEVTIVGTSTSRVANEQGYFRFDSVAQGAFRVEANDSLSRAVGVAAATIDVFLLDDKEKRADLRGDRTPQLLARLCGGALAGGRAAVRVAMIDERGNGPVSIPVRLTWTEYVQGSSARVLTGQQLQAETSADGSALFCGVPANISVEFSAQLVGTDAWRVATFQLVAGLNAKVIRTVTLRVP